MEMAHPLRYNGYYHRLNARYRLIGNTYDYYGGRGVCYAYCVDIHRFCAAAVSYLFGTVYFLPDFLAAYICGAFHFVYYRNAA